MSFEYPWVLFALVLPVVFLITEWRKTPSRIGLLLKTAAFLAVVLALASPSLEVDASKVAAVVLVDTSASIPPSDLERASKLVREIEGERGRHWLRVIPFARASREMDATEFGGSGLKATGGELGRATDLEAAIRDAIAGLPSGMAPRIALVSDGRENQGSVARAAWLARDLRIPIDTFALPGRPQPLLRIESSFAPAVAFTGEKFPIDLVVSAPKAASGAVELSAEGKALGSSDVKLEAGSNVVRVFASLNASGAVDVSGVLRSPGLGDAPFEHAITLRKPRVLFLSQDPAGTEQHLLGAIQSAHFDVTHTASITPARFADYQLIVFNNWDLETLPLATKNAAEQYVKQGGGLLVIGGERNVYPEGKKVEDAMDRTLPAKLAPPKSPEGTCVVLIMDKSSSMEGRKMELARISAIGVIDNLRPTDNVGVLIFDNSNQWAVPIRKAEDKTLIKRLIAGVTPDGGTQIAPALSEAYRRIQTSSATYRHVVLLTDGISEEGDSMSVAKDALGKKITISTVGLGQDVNRAYLEKIASTAKGRSYFLTDPAGLEQILIKDVLEHTGSTAVEKAITPSIAKQSPVLEGVPMAQAPALNGYVRFISKPGADTVLTVDIKQDPLFTVWQAGLGRAAVFASDAKSRWAEKWVAWNGFDRFWVNVFRNLLPHAQPGETTTSYEPASGNLIVDYKLAPQAGDPGKVPDIFVFGPQDYKQPMPVRKVAEGQYRGTVPIGAVQGLFRIRPVEESRFFPETGFYRPEEELTQYGSNEPLLKQVSAFTGGRFQPSPSRVFDASGRSTPTTITLWPGLLALAIALNVAELVMRKWRGIVGSFTRRAAHVDA
ncbi:MAG TPA: VWA domain-containing protein [Bryobacteraceae bacterium]|nr:VWA domain-containing protein [Bryobacteraceae bacterium]